MGLETFGEKIKAASPENYKVELEQGEKEVMQKVKEIFQENTVCTWLPPRHIRNS